MVSLWLLSSDVWGYQLLVDRTEVEAFSSNPNYFGEGRGPEGGPPGARELCARCGLSGREKELTEIQRKRHVFADPIIAEFASAIGAPGAATSFKYELESAGADERWSARGYRFELLFFERPGNGKPVPVHSTAYPKRTSPPQVGGAFEIPRPLAFQIALLRVVFIPFQVILWIIIHTIAVPARLIRKHFLTVAPSPPQRVAPEQWHLDGCRLVSLEHLVSVTLRDDAAPASAMPYRCELAFETSGLRVECNARPNDAASTLFLLRPGVDLEEDERYFAGELAVRGMTTRTTRREAKPVVRMCEIVATPRALYVFHASAPEISPEVRRRVRAIVASFEMGPSARREVARGPHP